MQLDAVLARVLHRRPHGEKDLWLELWTREHGRLPVMAHRVRQPGAGRMAELAPHVGLRIWARGRSEPLSLREWELTGQAPLLSGAAALTGMYLNELCYRTLPRGEVAPALFDRYVDLLERLARTGTQMAAPVGARSPATGMDSLDPWLRAFELALLRELGYGLDLSCTSAGVAVRAEGRYRVDLESGVQPDAEEGWPGGLLLGLMRTLEDTTQVSAGPASAGPTSSGPTSSGPTSADRAPDASERRQQRRLLRTLLQQLLGDRPLQSWSLVRYWPR